MSRVTATVLFTDLVGSTELRGRLGDDAADELRRKHDDLLTQVVEANSGRVVKGLGDGIMATFAGASDAVDAAVAIQQAVDRLNRSGKTGVPLDVRVGLSAGDVAFEDDDVHGTPVIEASRLCGAAGGGEILAADLVRALAGSSTGDRFEGVGPLELKGLGEAVQAVRVGWEPLAVSTVPVPTLLTDMGRIFVGRDAELERLGQLWKEAVAGECRVALLAGEPGVGKTRLAAELAHRAHDDGGVVLGGRCDEDLGVPYQPFVEALRHFVDHTPPPDLAGCLGRYGGELSRLLPELTDRVLHLPPPMHSDPETERYRLFDAVAAWLSAVSTDGPVLLVLDDLQWAAKPTLLLLRHVVRAAKVGRLLIVGTYRDTELTHDHPLVDLVADLRRQGDLERLAMSGLDDAAVTAMVAQAAGHSLDENGVAVARAIYDETEGNPFFVREVLRHLAETKAIEREADGWRARVPIEQLGIPEGVRDVVGRRLARLSQAANYALRAAAVVGAEFDAALLQAAGELDEHALLAALDEAIEARLITEVSATRFRFSHALVRATLYDALTELRKVALHRHVAEAIEALQEGELDDHLPALAHHWAKASVPADAGRAVDYARRAGDRAFGQLAHDEAADYYRQALDFLDGTTDRDGPLRLELLISLGEAQRRAGNTAHRETLLEAARRAAAVGDAHALARAALANTRGFYGSATGEVDRDRVGALEAALQVVEAKDTTTRARLLAALATELLYAGERERRVRLADEALAIARRTGDGSTLAHVLLERFVAISFPDTLAERLAISEELIPLAEQLGDPAIAVRAFIHRFRALMESGAIGEAERHLEAAERLTFELGQPTLTWLVHLNRTGRTILAGNLGEAERQAQAGFELGRSTGQPDAASYLSAHVFQIRYEQGRLDELEDRFVDMVSALPALPLIRAWLALLLCELDRSDEATAHYDRLAADGFRGIPHDNGWMLAAPPCAQVCARLGDRAGARVLFDLLEPFADQVSFATGGSFGAIAHHLAVLATTFSDYSEAERRFAEATSTHDRMGAPAWLARTRLEWARMLVTRRQPGDLGRAQELLDDALGRARAVHSVTVERGVARLLRDMQ